MSVDVKLREASESVRQARREVRFTSRAPGHRRWTRRAPILGAVVAFVLVLSFSIPVLLSPPGASQPTEVVAASAGFPLLILNDDGWYADSARDTVDEETGERIGTWVGYTNPEGGIMALSVRSVPQNTALADEPDPTGGPEAETLSMASESRQIQVNNAEAILYFIPADALSEEGNVRGVRWIPQSGIEAIMFTSQLDEAATIELANSLVETDETTWNALTAANGVVPTSTAVDGHTPTTLGTADQ
jgi:hypothetical protein